jgi:toxin-antitoxin system PIN domain toxin
MDAITDVNVVFALMNERHIHHQRVFDWLDHQEPGFTMGICRLVQMALIRLLSNASAMDGDPLSLSACWRVYADLINDASFKFVPEPRGFQPAWIELCQPFGASPKVLNDAYLAAIAQTMKIPLVTLDKDFRQFSGISLLAI